MDVMEEVGSVSQEAFEARKKAVAEEKVIPRGYYEGVVFTYNIQEPTERTPFELIGKKVYSIGLRLDVNGTSRTAFVKMTPDELFKADGKTPKPKYGSAIDLAGLFGMINAPFTDVLEQAKVQRARYNIQVWYKQEDTERKDPQGNWVKDVSAPRS
jgi:hypothetical protein